jgi:RHS repeat-associated protein
VVLRYWLGAYSVSEYTGDYNELTYLRARHYAPRIGRFITRDRWAGNANHPTSFNKWQYAYSNPVNLTDPSGYFPEWCQSMPNKETYAVCVLTFYKLQVINPFDIAKSVQGEKGCYTGPTEYRAPGYIEGYGSTFTSVWYVGFHEMVYDFATMQRTDFNAKGYGLHDTSIGLLST